MYFNDLELCKQKKTYFQRLIVFEIMMSVVLFPQLVYSDVFMGGGYGG